MIFTGFKRKTNQIFFNKQLPILLKKSNETPLSKVKKVLVLLDDIELKQIILTDLKKVLDLQEEDIEIIVFQMKNKKLNIEETVFLPKDFGWYGKIKSKALNNILTKKYDLLINYSKVDNIYSNLLLLQSETAFKVGFAHLDNRLYQLTISCKLEEIELFNMELKKYLTILKRV